MYWRTLSIDMRYCIDCPFLVYIILLNEVIPLAKSITASDVISRITTKYPHLDCSALVYVNSITPVELKCKIHNITFMKRISNIFPRQYVCPLCERESSIRQISLSQEQFVSRAMTKNPNGDYSNSVYNGWDNYVVVKCTIHGGEYLIKPSVLLDERLSTIIGCPICKRDHIDHMKRKPVEQLKAEFNLKHDNKYQYPFADFKNNKDSIPIVCPIHGEFLQRITSHLNGCGCPKCSSSYGERKIRSYLIANDIPFSEQYTTDACKLIRNLPFDFIITTKDGILLVEYNGVQHYQPVAHFGGESYFKQIQSRDAIKRKYCADNNIALLTIEFSDYDRIEEILGKALGIEGGK